VCIPNGKRYDLVYAYGPGFPQVKRAKPGLKKDDLRDTAVS